MFQSDVHDQKPVLSLQQIQDPASLLFAYNFRKDFELSQDQQVSNNPFNSLGFGEFNHKRGIWKKVPDLLSVIDGEQRSRPYAGLKNLGSTCYLNAFLQTLFMNYDFREALFKTIMSPHYMNSLYNMNVVSLRTMTHQTQQAETLVPHHAELGCFPIIGDPSVRKTAEDRRYTTKGFITPELRKLFALMLASDQAVVDPSAVACVLKVNPLEEQDASEFGAMLFMALEGELPNFLTHNFIRHLFCGRAEFHSTCQECQSVKVNPDSFFEIRIQASHHQDDSSEPYHKRERRRLQSDDAVLTEAPLLLEDGLQRVFRSEIMSGENSYDCEICQKKTAVERQLQIKSLPPYIFIVVQRYVYDSYRSERRKLHFDLDYPLELDMRPYIGANAVYTIPATDSEAACAKHNREDLHPKEVEIQPIKQDMELPLGMTPGSTVDTTYDFVGVLEHVGAEATSGHYTAILKDEAYERVRPVSSGSAARQNKRRLPDDRGAGVGGSSHKTVKFEEESLQKDYVDARGPFGLGESLQCHPASQEITSSQAVCPSKYPLAAGYPPPGRSVAQSIPQPQAVRADGLYLGAPGDGGGYLHMQHPAAGRASGIVNREGEVNQQEVMPGASELHQQQYIYASAPAGFQPGEPPSGPVESLSQHARVEDLHPAVNEVLPESQAMFYPEPESAFGEDVHQQLQSAMHPTIERQIVDDNALDLDADVSGQHLVLEDVKTAALLSQCVVAPDGRSITIRGRRGRKPRAIKQLEEHLRASLSVTPMGQSLDQTHKMDGRRRRGRPRKNVLPMDPLTSHQQFGGGWPGGQFPVGPHMMNPYFAGMSSVQAPSAVGQFMQPQQMEHAAAQQAAQAVSERRESAGDASLLQYDVSSAGQGVDHPPDSSHAFPGMNSDAGGSAGGGMLYPPMKLAGLPPMRHPNAASSLPDAARRLLLERQNLPMMSMFGQPPLCANTGLPRWTAASLASGFLQGSPAVDPGGAFVQRPPSSMQSQQSPASFPFGYGQARIIQGDQERHAGAVEIGTNDASSAPVPFSSYTELGQSDAEGFGLTSMLHPGMRDGTDGSSMSCSMAQGQAGLGVDPQLHLPERKNLALPQISQQWPTPGFSTSRPVSSSNSPRAGSSGMSPASAAQQDVPSLYLPGHDSRYISAGGNDPAMDSFMVMGPNTGAMQYAAAGEIQENGMWRSFEGLSGGRAAGCSEDAGIPAGSDGDVYDNEVPAMTAGFPIEGGRQVLRDGAVESVIMEVVPAEVIPTDVMPAEVVPAEVVPAEVVPAEVVPAEVVPAESTVAKDDRPTPGLDAGAVTKVDVAGAVTKVQQAPPSRRPKRNAQRAQWLDDQFEVSQIGEDREMQGDDAGTDGEFVAMECMRSDSKRNRSRRRKGSTGGNAPITRRRSGRVTKPLPQHPPAPPKPEVQQQLPYPWVRFDDTTVEPCAVFAADNPPPGAGAKRGRRGSKSEETQALPPINPALAGRLQSSDSYLMIYKRKNWEPQTQSVSKENLPRDLAEYASLHNHIFRLKKDLSSIYVRTLENFFEKRRNETTSLIRDLLKPMLHASQIRKQEVYSKQNEMPLVHEILIHLTWVPTDFLSAWCYGEDTASLQRVLLDLTMSGVGQCIICNALPDSCDCPPSQCYCHFAGTASCPIHVAAFTKATSTMDLGLESMITVERYPNKANHGIVRNRVDPSPFAENGIPRAVKHDDQDSGTLPPTSEGGENRRLPLSFRHVAPGIVDFSDILCPHHPGNYIIPRLGPNARAILAETVKRIPQPEHDILQWNLSLEYGSKQWVEAAFHGSGQGLLGGVDPMAVWEGRAKVIPKKVMAEVLRAQQLSTSVMDSSVSTLTCLRCADGMADLVDLIYAQRQDICLIMNFIRAAEEVNRNIFTPLTVNNLHASTNAAPYSNMDHSRVHTASLGFEAVDSNPDQYLWISRKMLKEVEDRFSVRDKNRRTNPDGVYDVFCAHEDVRRDILRLRQLSATVEVTPLKPMNLTEGLLCPHDKLYPSTKTNLRVLVPKATLTRFIETDIRKSQVFAMALLLPFFVPYSITREIGVTEEVCSECSIAT